VRNEVSKTVPQYIVIAEGGHLWDALLKVPPEAAVLVLVMGMRGL
jgi:hypothetical protein